MQQPKFTNIRIRLTASVEAATEALVSWFPLTLLIGASPALFLWMLFHDDALVFLTNNTLDYAERLKLLVLIFGSIGVTLLFSYFFRKKIQVFIHNTIILVALPLLPILWINKIEVDHPFFTLFICALIGGIVVYAVYRSLYRVFDLKLLQLSHLYGWALVITSIVVYVCVISRIHITHHQHFKTSIYDLGLYANIFWQTIHGHLLGCSFLPGGNHLVAHFDPILILLSPLYLIHDGAETLLVFQTVWLAAGAIPVYVLTSHYTKQPVICLAISLIYLLYPALHGMNLYDFHSLVIAAPLFLWLMVAIEKQKHVAYWFILLMLLLVREDIPLLTCFVGLYLIAEKKWVREGSMTIIISLLYFVAVKYMLMPLFVAANDTTPYSFSYYFQGIIPKGVEPLSGIIFTMFTNPLYVIKHAMTEEKILYFCQLLLPLFFLVIFSKRMWLLFLYGIAITLLATRKSLYTIGFQYATFLCPFFFASMPYVLSRMTSAGCENFKKVKKERFRLAVVMGMLVTSVLISKSFGGFWENSSFQSGYLPVERTMSNEDEARFRSFKQIAEKIPSDASVTASEHIGAHMANRKNIYRFPETDKSEFLILLEEDLFAQNAMYLAKLQAQKKYQLIIKNRGILLFKRIVSTKL